MLVCLAFQISPKTSASHLYKYCNQDSLFFYTPKSPFWNALSQFFLQQIARINPWFNNIQRGSASLNRPWLRELCMKYWWLHLDQGYWKITFCLLWQIMWVEEHTKKVSSHSSICLYPVGKYLLLLLALNISKP